MQSLINKVVDSFKEHNLVGVIKKKKIQIYIIILIAVIKITGNPLQFLILHFL